MPTFRLTVEYDGAQFEGWQAQGPGHRTVQGILEEALRRIAGTSDAGLPVVVEAAGRTDAGVHAEGQLVSIALDTRLSAPELQRALNGVLPDDLAVLDLKRVAADFRARRAARSKLYRYAIWNGPVRSPLRARRFYAIRAPLDLAAMRQAAKELLGTHDFAAFQAAGSSVRTSVRSLTRLDLEGEAGGEVLVWVEGTGFLRHMVRNLVGTLVEVGLARRGRGSMAELLASRDRGRAGPTAPAHGLTLASVRDEGDEAAFGPRDDPGGSGEIRGKSGP